MSRNRKLALIIFAIVGVSVLGPFIALSTDISKPEQPTHELDSASVAAKNYMDKYVATNGTVSGKLSFANQSQALLIAAATADRSRFDSVWQRTQTLRKSDGTWGDASAGDMLLTIRAFLVASDRLSNPAYQVTAKQLSAQLLATNQLQSETIDAGTSVFRTLKELQALTGDSQWATIADARHKALSDELAKTKLPVDTAKLHDGTVVVEAGSLYGPSAQRATLFLGDSCEVADSDVAKKLWLTLRLSPVNRVATTLDANGAAVNRQPATLPAVATAATAEAAGEHVQALHLLDQADAMAKNETNAEASGWDAIGRIVVSTDWLGACP
jgi:hypothetical protein